jgi:hypothetical protein
MKLVKEILYEKFTEEGDPIRDMGIGVITFENIKTGDVIICIKQSNNFVFSRGDPFPRTGLYIVTNVIKPSKHKLTLTLLPYGYDHPGEKIDSTTRNAINNCKIGHIEKYTLHTNTANISTWKKYFKIYQPRDLKESLNEKFTEESDPIHDLGIGYNVDFEEIANNTIRNAKNKYGQTKWIEYLRSITGKTITGYFKNEKGIKTFKITYAMSMLKASKIEIWDEDDNVHITRKNKKYMIK